MIRRGVFLAFVALTVSLIANLAQAQFPPSTTDLWDVSNGNVVTGNSAVLAGVDARDMFGAVAPASVEPGNLLFQDAQAAGFVHFVEWMTPSANTVASIVLNAGHDAPPPIDANERGFSQFRLYARNPNTNAFDILVFQYSPSNPYGTSTAPPNGLVFTNPGNNEIQLCVNIAPVTASEFRAEFVQYGDRTPSARGPRIFELDAFTDSRCTRAPAAAPAEIPTLSEATLILLATLLATGGFLYLRRES